MRREATLALSTAPYCARPTVPPSARDCVGGVVVRVGREGGEKDAHEEGEGRDNRDAAVGLREAAVNGKGTDAHADAYSSHDEEPEVDVSVAL